MTGDVVLAVRGSYDRSALVPMSMAGANVSRDVVRLAALEGLLPEYLQIYLQSSFAQQYFARHARGVAVKGVNIASLRAMPVVIPPLLEQRAIVEAVRAQMLGLDTLQVALDKARTRATHLRRAILAHAFSGKLVPQDPTDEPASELLARIEAERASLATRKATTVRRARTTATAARPPEKTTTVSVGIQEELPLWPLR
jgi:type I restriction enzyme S subunit